MLRRFDPSTAIVEHRESIVRALVAEEHADAMIGLLTAAFESFFGSDSRLSQRPWKRRPSVRSCPCSGIVPSVMYTTNAVESLNYSLRKVTRNRLAFPTTDAAMKLCFMAIQNISKKWRMPIRHWSQALNYLAIKFDGRVPV